MTDAVEPGDAAAANPMAGDPMAALVAALPTQLVDTRRRLAGWTLPLAPGRPAIQAVVVCGMGGSAIAADIVAGALSDRAVLPITVVRSAHLPGWVGPDTLVVASSHSGRTRETRLAWQAARRAGARVVVVTAGEDFAAEARDAGAAVIAIPPGGPPRAALGHGIAAMLTVLEAAGAVPPGCDVGAAAAAQTVLDGAFGDALSPSALADALVERVPLLYAADALAPVARRWKGQLNENAKALAVTDTLPEMFHNTVVGFGHPSWLAERATAVFLGALDVALAGGEVGVQVIRSGSSDRAEAAARAEDVDRSDAHEHLGTAGMRTLLEDRGIASVRVVAPHPHGLAAALWLVSYGDVLSLALAARYTEAPTPIAAIDELKRRVGAAREGPRAG
ncbi:MAG: SIS domain-containing protein [Ardenticatenales bacterium]|nr:SIS domain-containing protein [Ardenticatenales bacterium]